MSTATEAGHLRGVLLCTCAGLILLAGTARAGVTADGGGVTEPSAVSAADLNRAGELKRAQAHKGRSSLKCYQEGKLVHESADVVLSGRQAPGVITLQSASSGHPVLQLIDIKGGLCVVESRTP